MNIFKPLALQYICRLVVGSVVVWWGLEALGIPNPKWAVISLIVVTEPELNKVRENFVTRSVNTLAGCVIACAALLIFGADLFAMLFAIAVSVVVATTIEHYPSSWRLAPATTVLLIAAAFDHIGMRQELRLVLLRAGEVLAGGAIAIGLAYSWDRVQLLRQERADALKRFQ